LGQGRENARRYLRENPELAAEIERLIREELGIDARQDGLADESTVSIVESDTESDLVFEAAPTS
jgi:recombination protein RecA